MTLLKKAFETLLWFHPKGYIGALGPICFTTMMLSGVKLNNTNYGYRLGEIKKGTTKNHTDGGLSKGRLVYGVPQGALFKGRKRAFPRADFLAGRLAGTYFCV